ncbi:hypothetical protein QWJ34_17240 [Saccharibacillus sp. CPCC 101409]|uniref:hypothetical protein n=1 Tax=Saccharibacillus sp. CPCC 101409 TaxID=3058041 RepID=UPI002671C15B|nr:hypothetical protein [Saccharibacillus sp. CPCC 101409]MDO3411513.1 hypothetical protein [Saccharibacillus sp. CPCC 101409]
MKKIKSLLMAITILSLIFSFYTPSASAASKDNLNLPEHADLIIKEVLESLEADRSKNFSTASASEPEIVVLEQGYAIQIENQTSNNETAITTIIPYKIDTNKEFVNSFDYLEAQQPDLIRPMAESTVPNKVVDVTLTIKTYYAQYFSWANVTNFYRHGGIEAWWSSSNTAVSVPGMTVKYETRGDLYRYPDCIDQPLSSTKVQNSYFKRSIISQSNPVKGAVYIDGNNTMPLDRVVTLTDYFNHGGVIDFTITQSLNGITKTSMNSYNVYSK